ncbi:hypothetical protein MMC09_003113 [Bachmanniomyces sp. S44760]|nr:hypothetical protein [Bachmanniomyces sp. S44760]
MLSSLIRPTPQTSSEPEDVEDIFSSSLEHLFTNDTQNIHGEPGSSVIYRSSQFGDIELGLAEPVGHDDIRLFAHYQWNAGIMMGELIGQGYAFERGERATTSHWRSGRAWRVEDESVLELGAGTGLGGITSALAGAAEVTLSDYPSSTVLDNLQANVATNCPPNLQNRVSVQGHEWGNLTDNLSKRRPGHFTRILAADCLWMPWQHANIARSMLHFLSPEKKKEARVWVIAGFHTGRAKLASFFDVVVKEGLEVEDIWERDTDFRDREWVTERDGGFEDVTGRKRWLVIAVLRRKGEGG